MILSSFDRQIADFGTGFVIVANAYSNWQGQHTRSIVNWSLRGESTGAILLPLSSHRDLKQ